MLLKYILIIYFNKLFMKNFNYRENNNNLQEWHRYSIYYLLANKYSYWRKELQCFIQNSDIYGSQSLSNTKKFQVQK